jgi:hypothetical protein
VIPRPRRRRRLTLAAAALVLTGGAVAVLGSREGDSPDSTSSSLTYEIRSVAGGTLVSGVSADGRVGPSIVVPREAMARAARRGGYVTTELHLNQATGLYEVRLTTAH